MISFRTCCPLEQLFYVGLTHGSCVSFAHTRVSIVGWIYDPDHSLPPGMYVDVPHLIPAHPASLHCDHLPPHAAAMPRSSKPAAIPRNDSQPAACSSLMVGRDITPQAWPALCSQGKASSISGLYACAFEKPFLPCTRLGAELPCCTFEHCI